MFWNLADRLARKDTATITAGIFFMLVVLSLVHSRLVYRLLPNLPDIESVSAHQERMLRYHLRGDGMIPAGSLLFFGDSIIQGLPISAVLDGAVNYGIGGDTTYTLLQRLPNYQSISQASVVVMAIGINDVLLGESDADILVRYRQILNAVPGHIPVLCSGLLPANKRAWQVSLTEHAPDVQRLTSLNTQIKQLCETEGDHFILAFDQLADQQGELRQEFHVGDGLHLNAAGNRILATVLCEGIGSVKLRLIAESNSMAGVSECEPFNAESTDEQHDSGARAESTESATGR